MQKELCKNVKPFLRSNHLKNMPNDYHTLHWKMPSKLAIAYARLLSYITLEYAYQTSNSSQNIPKHVYFKHSVITNDLKTIDT